MKNATKHSDDLRALFKRLQKEGDVDSRPTLDALDALVRGAMSADMSDARAEEAMKAIGKEFVDLNELRVATDLEIHELLGVKYPNIEQRVAMITQSLNDIFEREHTLSLDRLKTISKRDARQFIRDLPGITPFVEAYVMLFAFDGHAIPLDEQMVEYLRDKGILEEPSTIEDAQKFLEHHIKGEDMYEFYALLRTAAHPDGARKKARS